MAEPKTSEIVYPSGFYSFQTPVLMEYVAALNGVATGRRLDDTFAYLDLGCGDGFTIICLAAAYPSCRFIGIDLSAEHIAQGRALAAAGGITNVELIEASFADWRALDLPPLDYIAMHGVWTWIPDVARAAVLEIVGDRLKPGGLLYVGYNTLPGWSAIAPLRQFVIDWTRDMGPDAAANVAAALKHLHELRAKGADYFTRNPAASWILDEMAHKPVGYVVHEIYASHWEPLPFSAVLRQMRGAGLDFVGSAELPRNFPHSSVKSEFLPLLLKETDRERAELYRDYANNTFFRRDVFGRIAPGAERRVDPERLAQFPIGTRAPIGELTRTLALPGGPRSLEGEPYESIRRAIATGARRLDQLAALPALRALSREALIDAVRTLTLTFQVAPFARETEAPSAPERWSIPLPLNRRLLAEPVGNDPFVLVMAPTTGSATVVARPQALVLLAVAEAGEDAPAWSWDYAQRRNAWLERRGAPVKDRSGHLTAFRETKAAMRDRLAKWCELGIIAPA